MLNTDKQRTVDLERIDYRSSYELDLCQRIAHIDEMRDDIKNTMIVELRASITV